ncbi:thioester dehydrase [Pleionea sediminis]|uniref:ApeI family dehydratase n=1 Tax=Pleionea sediminis TaxID=2569479 RepID=UPI001186C1AF|nr:thioester dehydrase [Pleionea sediminis]
MRIPLFNERKKTTDQAIWELTIDPDIIFFQGHFPDSPVLPGVVQTQWAIEFAKLAWGVEVNCSQLKQIKFKEVILPDTKVVLKLDLITTKTQLRYEYCDLDEQVLSSGIIEKVTIANEH